uniref:Uncharacterized LOC115596727 n=1 Tax=Sparus aurata TaxID=8175 RepID=A0A671YCV2_SPAAU
TISLLLLSPLFVSLSLSSSGVNTLSGSFPKSHSSQYSDPGVARTPLSVDHSPDSGLVSTPLPSSRFRFVSWHRLEQCEVTGDQLTCPRVREGPSEGELFQREGDVICLERGRRGRRREEEGQRWEERLQENWENCLELNLSYQDLGDPFQQENFLRILRRLIRVEKLQLVDNSLTNLSSVRLPRYEPHYPEYTTTPSPVQQSELPVQRSWIPISCHRGVAQYQLMKNLFPCASQQCKQKLNSKKKTDAKNKNKQYSTRTTITKLYL